MYYEDNRVKDLKVAYIGGGSRGWAWGFMMDLAACLLYTSDAADDS